MKVELIINGSNKEFEQKALDIVMQCLPLAPKTDKIYTIVVNTDTKEVKFL